MMALYAISDLHLSLSADKPMDVFGSKWDGYMEKIRANWLEVVREEDYVLIPGDVSWATYLEQAYKDFEFISRLPGTKIISKGNHDYWWETLNKLNKFVREKGFKNIFFLHNNSILYKNIALCGTRGWICPDADEFSQKDEKIYLRELQRLEISIQQGMTYDPEEIIVALHYPPVNKQRDMESEFIKLLKKYNIRLCIYGHLHGEAQKNALEGVYDDIKFSLVACDYMDFKPLLIRGD